MSEAERMPDLEEKYSVATHAPIWFIVYGYKGERYHVLVDGATGMVVKGDIPAAKLGLF